MELASASELLAELRAKVEGGSYDKVLALEEATAASTAAIARLEAELSRAAAEAEAREHLLRGELSGLQISHRIELMLCMLLSLALSWALAAYCMGRHPADALSPATSPWPSPGYQTSPPLGPAAGAGPGGGAAAERTCRDSRRGYDLSDSSDLDNAPSTSLVAPSTSLVAPRRAPLAAGLGTGVGTGAHAGPSPAAPSVLPVPLAEQPLPPAASAVPDPAAARIAAEGRVVDAERCPDPTARQLRVSLSADDATPPFWAQPRAPLEQPGQPRHRQGKGADGGGGGADGGPMEAEPVQPSRSMPLLSALRGDDRGRRPDRVASSPRGSPAGGSVSPVSATVSAVVSTPPTSPDSPDQCATGDA